MTDSGIRAGRRNPDEPIPPEWQNRGAEIIQPPQYVVEMQPTRYGWAWAISLPQSVVWAGRPQPIGINPGIAHEMRGPFNKKGYRLLGVAHERLSFGWRPTKRGANNAATRAILRHRRSESQLAAAQAGYTVETP